MFLNLIIKGVLMAEIDGIKVVSSDGKEFTLRSDLVPHFDTIIRLNRKFTVLSMLTLFLEKKPFVGLIGFLWNFNNLKESCLAFFFIRFEVTCFAPPFRFPSKIVVISRSEIFWLHENLAFSYI